MKLSQLKEKAESLVQGVVVDLNAPLANEVSFNPDSPTQLSQLLFGGTMKETISEPVLNEDGTPVIFKSGQHVGEIKFKKVTRDYEYKGLGLKPLPAWETKKKGIYSTNEEVLKTIAKRSDHIAGKIADKILKIRELRKQISTYYDSTEELIYEEDSCVHAQFSHCGYGDGTGGGTDTGRLSCTKPNIQNQPKGFESDVKHHFMSRYPGGKIIEADFHQIEIAVQAQLSGDKKYIADVINGVDFHIKRLAMKEGGSYAFALNKIKHEEDPEWIEKRSKIKAFSFARAYGAGAEKISHQTGLSVEEIKILIQNEDLEYAELARYNQKLKEMVEYTARTEGANKMGYYKSPFGRRYYFLAENAPEWLRRKGVEKTFSPTKMKNYMIQGTATADIVLMMIGKFWREAIKHRDKFLIINTVHDSIILDCKKEYVNECKDLIQATMGFESIKEVIKQNFNYDWIVPIKIDVKVGNSWKECA